QVRNNPAKTLASLACRGDSARSGSPWPAGGVIWYNAPVGNSAAKQFGSAVVFYGTAATRKTQRKWGRFTCREPSDDTQRRGSMYRARTLDRTARRAHRTGPGPRRGDRVGALDPQPRGTPEGGRGVRSGDRRNRVGAQDADPASIRVLEFHFQCARTLAVMKPDAIRGRAEFVETIAGGGRASWSAGPAVPSRRLRVRARSSTPDRPPCPGRPSMWPTRALRAAPQLR